MIYRDFIREILSAAGRSEDLRCVEAYMRLEFGTLDALSTAQFQKACLDAADCVAADPAQAVALADSFGLR